MFHPQAFIPNFVSLEAIVSLLNLFLLVSKVCQVELALKYSQGQFYDEFEVEKPSHGDQVIFTCMRGIRSNTALFLAQNLGYKRCGSEYFRIMLPVLFKAEIC